MSHLIPLVACLERPKFSPVEFPPSLQGYIRLLDAGEYDKVPFHSHGALKLSTRYALRILLAAILVFSALC